MSFDPSHPLFTQAVVAAERCARNGMPISAESLNSEDPRLPIYAARDLLDDRRFAAALEELGINFTPQQQMSNEQLAAAHLYLTAGEHSHTKRLRAAGISQAKWAGWMRQPQFVAYISQHAQDRLHAALPAAHVAIADQASEGKQWAVQLLYKMTGFFDPDKVDDPRKYFEAIFEELEVQGVSPQILASVATRLRELQDPASALRTPVPAMITVSESPTQEAS